jgi:MFS family permease
LTLFLSYIVLNIILRDIFAKLKTLFTFPSPHHIITDTPMSDFEKVEVTQQNDADFVNAQKRDDAGHSSDHDSLPETSERTLSVVDPEQAPQPAPKLEDVAPDGGYGWVVVACLFLINAHTWGINSSYGVFLAHYLALNTYPGATPLEYAFIGGLSIAMCLSVSPVATISTREFGTRVTLFIGVFLQTVALLGASWSKEIWQLFLSQGVCFGWGMGFLFVASVPIIPQWFDKKRSFANSISAAGSGIGGLIYSLATNAMIENVGLGWAFRILAIVSCVVISIAIILIRDRNKQIGSVQLAFDTSLLRRPEFLLLLGWGMFSMLGYVVLLFSLPNYARSIGLSAAQGSVIGALLNLGQGIGRPAIGFYSDSFGRINIALLGTFLSGLFSLVIWIFAKSYGVMIFYSLLTGAFAGTFWTTIAPVSAEVVGIKILPSALSLIWISLIVPSTFAEPIALELKRTTGNIYLHSQIFTGFMYIAASICLWFLRAWKINEVAKAGVADAEKREQEIRNDDEVPRPALSRTVSVAATTAKTAKGLFVLQKV